jgi:general secretion pathway protein J
MHNPGFADPVPMQSPFPPPPNRLRGFTLIEILLAIFIFSIVLAAIYGSYTGTFRAIDTVESQAAVFRQARIAMARMTEDLASSYYSEMITDMEKFVGTEQEVQGMRADTLRFISKAHLLFNDQELAAGSAQIFYEVREDVTGEGLALYRHDTPELVAGGGGEDGGGLLLCDRLEEVRFSYYDAAGNEQDSWDAADADFMDKAARERIPRMVAIKLAFINDKNPEAPYTFMTSIILPISRES